VDIARKTWTQGGPCVHPNQWIYVEALDRLTEEARWRRWPSRRPRAEPPPPTKLIEAPSPTPISCLSHDQGAPEPLAEFDAMFDGFHACHVCSKHTTS